MTNFENKKDECMKILAHNMALVGGKLVLCEGMNCYNCDFYEIESCCDEQALEWLLAEYQEPAPKLTKREREFLECFTQIESKEIRREEDGFYVYSYAGCGLLIADDMFPFINSGETWTFTDLMELEVEE